MLARSYDEVVAKYALPAPQDGPQNQTESKPAIEEEKLVESTHDQGTIYSMAGGLEMVPDAT